MEDICQRHICPIWTQFHLFGTLYGKAPFPFQLPSKMHNSFPQAHRVFPRTDDIPIDTCQQLQNGSYTKKSRTWRNVNTHLIRNIYNCHYFLPIADPLYLYAFIHRCFQSSSSAGAAPYLHRAACAQKIRCSGNRNLRILFMERVTRLVTNLSAGQIVKCGFRRAGIQRLSTGQSHLY